MRHYLLVPEVGGYKPSDERNPYMTTPVSETPAAPPAKKKGGKLKWILIGILVIVIIAVAANAGKKDTPVAATPTITASNATTTSAAAPSAASEAPSSAAPESAAPVATSTTAAAPVNAVGSPVAVEWTGGKGTVTINSAEWSTTATNEIIGAPKNGAYLTLDVTIDATEGKVTYNPLYFSVKNESGQEFNMALGGKEPSLSSGELTAPDKVRGFVAFDVAKGAVKVTVKDELLQPLTSWNIA